MAIKKIKKAHIKDEEALSREFQIVKELHHPNIVEFYESFEGECACLCVFVCMCVLCRFESVCMQVFFYGFFY